MSRDEHETNTKRRAFLKGSMVAGAGAAVVATVPAMAAAVPEVNDLQEAVSGDDGYKLSAHILKYYQTAAS